MPPNETMEKTRNEDIQALANATLERELDLCAAAGGDREALKGAGYNIYQLEQIRKGYEQGLDVSLYIDPKLSWMEMEELRMETAADLDMSRYRKQGFTIDQVREIRLGMMEGLDTNSYADKRYFSEQMKEIRLGLKAGLPVIFYLDPNFNSLQMAEIRKGLSENFDISVYARPEMPFLKMRAIRNAMEVGLNFDDETIDGYDAGILDELVEAHRQNLDITPFLEEGYNDLQLKQIRISMAENLYFEPYIRKDMRGESLKEIRLGLEANLDVSVYADPKFRWRQMREIRLGLEKRLDVTVYANPHYIHNQMREIRLGLEKGLDVSRYASLVFTSYDMRRMRLKMEAGEDPGRLPEGNGYIPELYGDPVLPPELRPDPKKLREIIDKERRSLDERLHPDKPIELHTPDADAVLSLVESVAREDTEGLSESELKEAEDKSRRNKEAIEHATAAGQRVIISPDKMKCVMSLPKPKSGVVYSTEVLLLLMKKAGVVKGIDLDALTSIIDGERYDEEIVVASGKEPVNGKDGSYEYFFNRTPTSDPEIEEDGSAVFTNVHFQGEVKAGDKLATYHKATRGEDGFTVTGEVISARNGIEKPVLKGRGFILMQDKKSYSAALSGVVKMDGNILNIHRLLIVDDDVENGQKIDYLGSVHIKGNIRAGALVKAQGDIIVDGVAEAAMIDAGGDVFLKEGAVGGTQSIIRAAGIVASKYFENCRVRAKGSVYGNSFLHCNIVSEEKLICFGEAGTVYGGRIDALLGVEAAIIGTRNETKTTICIGVTGEMWGEYNDIEKRQARVSSEIAILKERQKKMADMPMNTREQLQMKIKVNAAITIKEKELDEVSAEKSGIVDRIRTVEGAEAIISDCVFAGTTFIIDESVIQITETKTATGSRGMVYKKGNRKSRAIAGVNPGSS